MLAVPSSGICLVWGGATACYPELVVVSEADSSRVDLNCKQIMDVCAKDQIRPMRLLATNARVAVIAWFCCQADYTSAMRRKSVPFYPNVFSIRCNLQILKLEFQLSHVPRYRLVRCVTQVHVPTAPHSPSLLQKLPPLSQFFYCDAFFIFSLPPTAHRLLAWRPHTAYIEFLPALSSTSFFLHHHAGKCSPPTPAC